MNKEELRERFRLIRANQRVSIDAADFYSIGPQNSLFPSAKKGLLIFVYFSEVTEKEFLETLEYAQPSFVLELRTTPRFDIGQLNRQQAFQQFEHQKCSYIDLTSSLMGQSDPNHILIEVRNFLQKAKPSLIRPLMILLNRGEGYEMIARRILQDIGEYYSGEPEVFEIPRFTNPNV
jgi:hypothetical protein